VAGVAQLFARFERLGPDAKTEAEDIARKLEQTPKPRG
jgi:hypothetical protein